MPTLANSRHELFAQHVVAGMSCVQAYMRAYGANERNARSHAARLRRRADVSRRIDEMLEEAAAEVGISAIRVLDELAAVAFASMGDFVDFGADGITLRDKASLTPDQLRAVAEVTQSSTGVRVKLHAKLDALEKLARHLGLYAAQKHEHTGRGGGPIENRLSLDEADRERLDKLDAAELARLYAETVAGNAGTPG